MSIFRSALMGIALPLIAIARLDVTPLQMGMLQAAESGSWLLLGFVAGASVDRLPRRRIMIATDLGWASLLSWIPLATLISVPRLAQLYVVTFLVGVQTVLFDVAAPAFLPVLGGRGQLVEGNSKRQQSRAGGDIGGPGMAGWLVQIAPAPVAILVDALSSLALRAHSVADGRARGAANPDLGTAQSREGDRRGTASRG